MFRKLTLAAVLALFASAAVVIADDEKKADPEKTTAKGKLGKGKAGKPDKAKVFETLDADSDGKISKEEFQKGMEKMAEKIKDRAGEKGGKLAGAMDKIAEKAFEKMDADKDGSISKDEFEKAEFDPSNLKNLREKFGKGK